MTWTTSGRTELVSAHGPPPGIECQERVIVQTFPQTFPGREGHSVQPVHPKSRGAARRAQRRGPTMEDVAEIAGVSRGTVSRVLNGGNHVSAASLEAVREAMRRTGYVVNQNARSLVTRRSGAVAFVLSEPPDRLFEDPVLGSL